MIAYSVLEVTHDSTPRCEQHIEFTATMKLVLSIFAFAVNISVARSIVSREWQPWSSSNSIQFRFPPSVDPSLDASWAAPPPGWIYGSWKVRYSSRAVYQYLWNFEADTYPALPTNISVPEGRNIDLTSFQTAPTGNATIDQHITTVFGYDYPQTDIAPYVFQFRGEGLQSATVNMWELLAWGSDENGLQWRVEYETEYHTSTQYGEPCINVVSRDENGPDPKTYQWILKGLQMTFASHSDLSLYASNITELPRDTRRLNMPPVACDAACMQNN